MTTMVKGRFVSTKVNDMMADAGFKYKVEGDWQLLDRVDPLDDMPEVSGNTHYFTDLNEAKAYAIAQEWVFNSDLRGLVEEVKHS